MPLDVLVQLKLTPLQARMVAEVAGLKAREAQRKAHRNDAQRWASIEAAADLAADRGYEKERSR